MNVLGAIRRLRRTTAAELRFRTKQAWLSQLERWRLRDFGEPRASDTHSALAPTAMPAFADLAATAAAIQDKWPDRVAAILHDAERVMQGRYSLLGGPEAYYPDAVDWHRDWVTNQRGGFEHWSRVPYLNADIVGDHKRTWELSRMQFLVLLGQAWCLSGDARYATRAAVLLTSWMNANPPKRGINWASSLEVAYRSMAWIWALRLFEGAPAFDPHVRARAIRWLEVAARHIEQNLSTYFSPNTHLTGEALALLYVGTWCPSLDSAPRWRDLGWRILVDECNRQVRPDGTYNEQALYYHRYTLDIYLHARQLASARPPAQLAVVDACINRLATCLAAVTRGDGTMPLFGDEDGGRLLFLDGSLGDDVRGSLAVAAATTGRSDLAYASRGGTDDVGWLLGAAGLRAFDTVIARPPVVASRLFVHGGLCVARTGWAPDDAVLTFDCGPLGTANGGHAHADTLAFDLALGAQPLFVDAGTVSYADPEVRHHLRTSQVHNTVTINNVSSSQPGSAFQWKTMANGVLDTFVAGEHGAFCEAHHDGYAHLGVGATHARSVLASTDWWIVTDIVTTRQPVTAFSTFQCAPGVQAMVLDSGVVQLLLAGRLLATLSVLGDGHWIVDTGIASRRYGAATPATRLRFHFSVADRTRVAFVIARQDRAPVEVAYGLESSASAWVRIRTSDLMDLICLDGASPAVGVQTDGRVAWVRQTTGAPARPMLVVAGTYLEVGGERSAASSCAITSSSLQ